MMMFCSLAIVTYTYRNKIIWRKIKIHRRIYIRLKQHAAYVPSLTFTYIHPLIRHYNPHKHTHTPTHSHTYNHTRRFLQNPNSFFLLYFFRFSIHLIFLTAWWLLFCKKLHETQGLQSKFHELDIYISNNYSLYIYIYWDSQKTPLPHPARVAGTLNRDLC